MTILLLILLGLCFGSFVNALVYRLHIQSIEVKGKRSKGKGKNNKVGSKRSLLSPFTFHLSPNHDRYSVINGRSMCVHCKHVLSAKDLVPVISWLSLKGRCRYCKKAISWQYPLVELATAVLFIVSYLCWPLEFTGYGLVSFVLWLVFVVGFMALLAYDIRWMLLPNKIIFFLYGVVIVQVVLRLAYEKSFNVLTDTVLAVFIGGGLFYVLFQISKGKWIGGGDVKLGFLIGAIVGTQTQAMLVLFIASLLGCLYVLPLLILKKANKTTRIPFGPFLILATVIVVLFGVSLTDWYFDTLLL